MQVYATRPIKPGEELVSVGLREQEQKALDKLQRRQEAKRGQRSIARAQQAAQHQYDLLKRSMLQLLLQSGWRQHQLGVMARRHYALAEQHKQRLRAAAAEAAAAPAAAEAPATTAEESTVSYARSRQAATYLRRLQRLNAAMREAALYYNGSADADGRSIPTSSTARLRRRLQDALEASLLAHPAPRSPEELRSWVCLPLEQQYRPAGLDWALDDSPRRACDFSQLPSNVARRLDRLTTGPELPEVRGSWDGLAGLGLQCYNLPLLQRAVPRAFPAPRMLPLTFPRCRWVLRLPLLPHPSSPAGGPRSAAQRRAARRRGERDCGAPAPR